MPDHGLGNEAPGDPAATAVDVAAICRRHGDDPANLIEILHAVQREAGCVPEALLPAIADALNLSRAEVHGVVSFYHDFRRAPAGRVVVKLCRAEACQSMGALDLIETVCRERGIALGETAADGVTIEPVYCLGNCALGPAALVNDRLVGRLTPARLEAVVAAAETGGPGR
ncbi:MAG: NAD(P)H-dependent oxidoreductase subunit E [Azospirillaceae bacterium]